MQAALCTEGALVAVTTGSSAFKRHYHGSASTPSCLPSFLLHRGLRVPCGEPAPLRMASGDPPASPEGGSPVLLGQVPPAQPPGSRRSYPGPALPARFRGRHIGQRPPGFPALTYEVTSRHQTLKAGTATEETLTCGKSWQLCHVEEKATARRPGKTTATSPHSTANWRLGSMPSTKQWGLLCFSQKS